MIVMRHSIRNSWNPTFSDNYLVNHYLTLNGIKLAY